MYMYHPLWWQIVCYCLLFQDKFQLLSYLVACTMVLQLIMLELIYENETRETCYMHKKCFLLMRFREGGDELIPAIT